MEAARRIWLDEAIEIANPRASLPLRYADKIDAEIVASIVIGYDGHRELGATL
jgi:hypothetical protein